MFTGFIGNAQAVRSLGRLASSGRMPHALLFAGPEGVGKKLAAFELARALVCRDPIDGAGCRKCAACMRAAVFDLPRSEKGDDYERVFLSEHPDIGMVIPFKNNVRIGAIRELEREAYFRPYEGGARVFIIDDADKMKDPAANALLKTLEEPAATSHIILVTSRPDALLQTIRSRCQTVRFAPVPAAEIERLLIDSGKFTAEDAGLSARLASGSVSRALSINIEEFRNKRELLLEVLNDVIVTQDLASLLQTAEMMNDAKNRDAFDRNLETLQTLLHDVWLRSMGSEEVVNSDIAPRLKELADSSDPAKVAGWINEVESVRQALAVNINKKIAVDALFMKMAVG